MYSFEGQYRSRPIQSLGGSSKNEPKEALLHRIEADRQKREKHRKQLTSAVKIQAFYRGCKVRQYTRDVVRQQFDEALRCGAADLSPASLPRILPSLWRQLLFFFRSVQDGSRLVWFCQVCMKHQAEVTRWIYRNHAVGVHNIQRLLWLCCKQLEMSNQAEVPAALPLRMLEIYTDPKSYSHSEAESKQRPEAIVHGILSFLIRNGYYRCMRSLVENKIPSSIELTIAPPTPMADSILKLIRKPFSIIETTDNAELRDEVLLSLCRELFCQTHIPQVECFVLPALSQDSQQFPFLALLRALTRRSSAADSKQSSNSQSVSEVSLALDGSIWLLYTILSLGEHFVERLNFDEMAEYLKVLRVVTQHLEVSRSGVDEDEDSDDDDITDMTMGEGHLAQTQQQCVDLVNKPSHVHCILTCLRHRPTDDNILSVCSICHVLLAHRKLAIHRTRLLYSLAFSPWFLQQLWTTCTSASTITVTGSQTPLLALLSSGFNTTQRYLDIIVPLLATFASLFSHSLFSLHDAEFYGDSHGNDGRTFMPFRVEELVPMSYQLRDACLGIIELAHPDTKVGLRGGYAVAFSSVGAAQCSYSSDMLHRLRNTWAHLFKMLSQLVKQLYSRDSRRPFCPRDHWLATRLNIAADKPSQIYLIETEAFQRQPFGKRSALNPNRQLEEEGPPMSTMEVRTITVLTELPFVVPFEERVKILQKLLNLDHVQHQRDSRHFSVGPMINITVRRSYLYEDAFERLSPENEPNLKLRVQVQLKNFQGLDEAGIDGGGIFREFMAELLKTAFDPNRGFFKYTNDKTLYPSPQAKLLVADFTQHYYFLGRILGKVLYENMLVELPFASFFLSKILSHGRGGEVDIHHLASLDPEMYKNLLYLKNYNGDVTDLGLDFTVVNNDLGEAQVEELKPGGRDISVTSSNRIEYIHLMADYRLNKQIRVHCQAFRQGLADVINIDWLRMFDHNELQVLISGAEVPIDTEDLRRNTNYSGGYTEDHPVIRTFWRVVQSFSDAQKRHLIKFVTSCSRPPLLGFKDLYPAFCVQCGGSEADRLPSASTCMNLLKLPEFHDERTMRQKLLYAIESGAGFELS